jgi:glycosyltransferase involved in cell wall biosynthesis
MNIMVYDIAAENGGAVSVLNYFYERHKNDKANHYYYMLSVLHLDENDNITVINVPKIKNSWISRLAFDYVGVKKYLKKYGIDEVISLQNTIIPCFKGKQTVYEHNALPFSEYRFSLREDRKMWIYQNIIAKFMIHAVKRADHVIVQTEWMKEAVDRRVKGAGEKTEIQFPKVGIPKGYRYKKTDKPIFFYPANGARFKNHRVVIEACEALKKDGYENYEVVFTLNGDETDEISKLYKISTDENLPVRWVGTLPREDVFGWYEKSALVFPSYIETVGLPIYEAENTGSPMILANCEYAKCVAKDYARAAYFDYDDAGALTELMAEYIAECEAKEEAGDE